MQYIEYLMGDTHESHRHTLRQYVFELPSDKADFFMKDLSVVFEKNTNGSFYLYCEGVHNRKISAYVKKTGQKLIWESISGNNILNPVKHLINGQSLLIKAENHDTLSYLMDYLKKASRFIWLYVPEENTEALEKYVIQHKNKGNLHEYIRQNPSFLSIVQENFDIAFTHFSKLFVMTYGRKCPVEMVRACTTLGSAYFGMSFPPHEQEFYDEISFLQAI